MSSLQQLSLISASLQFARMGIQDLAEVQRIEEDIYPFPWTTGNFADSLENGYETWIVREKSGALAAYFLMMLAVDEAHLLNVSVRRDLQRRGLGRMLLDKTVSVAREKGMTSVLLEVRPSNVHALVVYERYGFVRIGLRKGYYPADGSTREDAIVMRLNI